ncbi:helix-turn-helix domain-containing protein [Kineosporia sp. NBRC 101731]|uniref:winged helix-turn-helix domain-containing protein n=1 Tax=Kineosporia sp. NBRC 101731 TaxID=3032199 RepID=UPI002556DDEA|nr:helix-turn-helix domain-containing protein [Kineosporia sp. NBRC 101731]
MARSSDRDEQGTPRETGTHEITVSGGGGEELGTPATRSVGGPVPESGDTAEPPRSGAGTVNLSDPKAMRALAHPLRIAVLGELRVRGPQSVGMLCDLLDEAPGSISYHVGKLAQFGFVEEAPELARDRRERWWKASHTHTSWSPADDLKDPERLLASGALRRTIAQRYAQTFDQYLTAEPAMDPDWVAAATTGDSFLHLTLEQMRELQDELNDLVARWEDKAAPGAQDGTETVTLIYQLFRRPE